MSSSLPLTPGCYRVCPALPHHSLLPGHAGPGGQKHSGGHPAEICTLASEISQQEVIYIFLCLSHFCALFMFQAPAVSSHCPGQVLPGNALPCHVQGSAPCFYTVVRYLVLLVFRFGQRLKIKPIMTCEFKLRCIITYKVGASR